MDVSFLMRGSLSFCRQMSLRERENYFVDIAMFAPCLLNPTCLETIFFFSVFNSTQRPSFYDKKAAVS